MDAKEEIKALNEKGIFEVEEVMQGMRLKVKFNSQIGRESIVYVAKKLKRITIEFAPYPLWKKGFWVSLNATSLNLLNEVSDALINNDLKVGK
ncbi:hypothetical protein GHO29_01485 [Pseudomonas helleri]|uniref:Uncharacterized protein n=1 Tax=Pseudomonas helleri TaxID=1608996 RepID=A0A7X1XUD1_9PSED|nr:hypothetical protein [Pseudomonas helleri]MQU25139.1 hypothetical protein [Pseudomonas helleri]